MFYQTALDKVAENTPISITGEVKQIITHGPSYYLKIQIKSINSTKLSNLNTVYANVSLNYGSEITQGTLFKATSRLKKFRGRKNFNVFDSEYYAFANKVLFKGTLSNFNLLSHCDLPNYKTYLWEKLIDYKMHWLYYALLSGDKSSITAIDKLKIREMGLSHLLAISGLHIGIVFFLSCMVIKLIFLLIAFCFKRNNFQSLDINIITFIISLVICYGYVAVSGHSVSAQRAFLMLCVFVIAYVKNKEILNWLNLLYVFTLMLLINPFSLLNMGLYFSFIAVVSIFCVLNRFRFNQFNTFKSLILIQISLFISLMPLTAYAFGGISITGLIINFFVIPLMAFVIFPVLLVNLFFTVVYDDVVFLSSFDNILFYGYLRLYDFGSEYHWYHIKGIELEEVFFSYVIMLTIYLTKNKWLIIWPVALLSFEKIFDQKPKWQIDIFDVGHGTSVLISHHGNGLLYDLGSNYFNRYSLFEHIVKPNIITKEIFLEHTILSHQDKDHVGGLNELKLYDNFNSLSTFHNFNPHSSCKLKTVRMGELIIETFWPTAKFKKDNNNSCVVKISDQKFSVLLPGDIEQKVEKILVKQHNDKLNSDFLLIPHHGSKTSSSPNFINAVSPTISVYSRGYYSPWPIPHPSVINRYKHKNITTLDTALHGQIRIKIYADTWTVESARSKLDLWFLKN